MAVIQRSEFALALNQISSERGVPVETIMESIQSAILAAYKKDHVSVEDEDEEKEMEGITASLNDITGETKIMKDGKDITPPGFGRIATQTAKQVLLQTIREREKDAILAEYKKRLGTVVNGMILRFYGPTIIVDIGKAEAIIPQEERIPNESYFLNKKLAVYIKEIQEDTTRGREIVVSRTDSGLLEGLLKREVPEVSSGSVIVKEIVREPGSRAKIAVYSEQPGIDPVGSCVGQKGVRIQSIIDAVDGLEKIDVIQWHNDPERFIANALSPAKEITIKLNPKEKIAYVTAPQEELPLVIGRDGQNVRLASKLTGYTLEVAGSEQEKKEAEKIATDFDVAPSEK